MKPLTKNSVSLLCLFIARMYFRVAKPHGFFICGSFCAYFWLYFWLNQEKTGGNADQNVRKNLTSQKDYFLVARMTAQAYHNKNCRLK